MTDNPYLRAIERGRQRAAEAQEAAGGPTRGGTFWGQMAQGATLGFSDELRAMGRQYLGGEDYDEALADERASLEAYREEYPWRSLGGQVLGGAPWALAGPMGAAARGAGLAGRTAGAAVGGGLQGAAGGAGTAEGSLENRAAGAAVGGAVGAGVGAALEPVIHGVGAGARRVMDRVRPNQLRREYGIGRGAQESFLEDTQGGRQTVPEIQQRVREGGADMMPADTSRRHRRTADALVTHNRQGADEFIAQPVQARRDGRRGANEAVLDDVMGPRPNVVEERDNLRRARATRAASAYDAARQAAQGVPIDTEPLAAMAAQNMRARAQRGTPTVEEKVAEEVYGALAGRGAALDFDYLDEVQQRLSAEVRALGEKARRSGLSGEEARRLRALQPYRDEVVRALDDATGGGLYVAARGDYRDDSAVLDAFERGGQIRGEHDQELASWMAQQSPEAREAYRLRANDEIRQMMMASRSSDRTTMANLADPGTRLSRNVETTVGPRRYDRIRRRARAEGEKRATEDMIDRGSDTAARQTHRENPEKSAPPLGMDAFGAAVRGGWELVRRGLEAIDGRRTEGLAKILGAQQLDDAPLGAARDRILQLLANEEAQRAMPPAQRAALARLLLEHGITRGVSGAAGQNLSPDQAIRRIPSITVRPRAQPR